MYKYFELVPLKRKSGPSKNVKENKTTFETSSFKDKKRPE